MADPIILLLGMEQLPAVAGPLTYGVLQPRAEVVDDVVGLRQQVVRQRQVRQEDGGRRALGPGDSRH